MLVRSFRVPAYMNVEVHFTLYLDSVTTQRKIDTFFHENACEFTVNKCANEE
jgi:hypothetical protein